MSPRVALLVLILPLILLVPAYAQESPVMPDERTAVVERVETLLAERYVFADKGREAGAYARERLGAGAYDGAAAPDSFAAALTRDLQHVTRDKHLRVHYRAPGNEAASPPDPLRQHLTQRERARARNLGIQSVQVLDGNIGYLDLRFFPGEAEVREAYDAAMRLLANVDALIVDERQHGGGNPSGIRYLTSYFFDEPTHLNSLHWREGDTETVEEFWTYDEVAGPQRPDLPLFVLTSGRTFSGAEEFANNLKELGRATIVGETTGGGANPGGVMPAGERFGIFIPQGRAVNPISGTNWEGIGVEPDVKVPADEALEKALDLARPAAEAFAQARTQQTSELATSIRSRLARASAAFEAGQDGTTLTTEALREGLDAGLLSEGLINGLGYDSLAREDYPVATAIFRFNVEAFPASWNTYDSLGEAYAKQGEQAHAVAAYRQARDRAPASEHERIDGILSQL